MVSLAEFLNWGNHVPSVPPAPSPSANHPEWHQMEMQTKMKLFFVVVVFFFVRESLPPYLIEGSTLGAPVIGKWSLLSQDSLLH